MIEFEHHTLVKPDQWRWPKFTPEEIADSTTGAIRIDPDFLDWLSDVRRIFDQPMIVTSAYRTPQHQESISGLRTGSHVDGQAADIHVFGESAHKLLRVASGMGVLGIGVQQTGVRRSRYLHLDRWTKAPAGVRPTVWSY